MLTRIKSGIHKKTRSSDYKNTKIFRLSYQKILKFKLIENYIYRASKKESRINSIFDIASSKNKKARANIKTVNLCR